MFSQSKIESRYWPEPVAILSYTASPHEFVTVEAVGLETRQHYTTTLPVDVWQTLQIEQPAYAFDAPAEPFRLALEAERLRLAHTADPLLAANNAQVHLLPHQIEAVYGYMLPQQGRTAIDVSGEHDQYPYDLHSTGPGGTRCIEVKGTTTSRFLLSKNQRRAAHKLGKSYYLYIVRDPLGNHPHLTIIRDPLSKMDYDDVLYSGVRYVYNASTWRAAADEQEML